MPRRLWTIGTLTYTGGGLVILFCWLLLGDFAWSMKERSVMWTFQVLIKRFGASDFLSGVFIGTIPQALALVLTPIVSYFSDRHRGRWGRRIPFLLIPTPFAALAMVGLSYSPEIGTAMHGWLGGEATKLNATILATFAVFWTIFEVATLTANAVFFGLINDVVPKEVIGRFYGMFRVVGLGVAMLFNYWLLGKTETHYTAIFLGIGLLYGIGFTAMCLKVKEGSYPPPAESTSGSFAGLGAGLKSYFTTCFGQPYYLWLYASIALAWMAIYAVNLFSLFFAQKVGLSMDAYGKYLAATFFISFLGSYLIGMLADRFHPLRVGLVAIALYALVTLVGGFVSRDGPSFGLALVAFGVASGAWQTATASLTPRLLPQARFAQFDSARALVTSLSLMIVGPGMGWFLDHAGHDYRFTYFVSSALALLSLASGYVVYRRFRQLGGPNGYVAPE